VARSSPSSAAPDPFEDDNEEEEEEEDKLLRGELEEQQQQKQEKQLQQERKVAHAPLNKTKRPNPKRQSTIALASQLLDWFVAHAHARTHAYLDSHARRDAQVLPGGSLGDGDADHEEDTHSRRQPRRRRVTA
jgi:uncharacterized protein (DUF4415 family)